MAGTNHVVTGQTCRGLESVQGERDRDGVQAGSDVVGERVEGDDCGAERRIGHVADPAAHIDLVAVLDECPVTTAGGKIG